MSSNVFSEIQESKIFKNEEALSPEYLPDFLPHRENQVQEIARMLNPVTKGKKPQNIFLSGSPGIGKTCVTKFVFRELENFHERTRTVYINTWDYNTTPSLLTKIITELGGFIPRRGLSKDEIMEKFIEMIKKSKGGFVICLDEVDQLIRKDESALYNLLRVDQYVDNPFGLVMISNYDDILNGLEPRIKSSLNVNQLKFKGYSLQEMKDILLERCKEVFRVGALEDGVILLAANQAVNRGGDVRIGLQCLQKASRLVEKENGDKIKVNHMKDVLKSTGYVKTKILRKRLDGNEKKIVELLKEEDKIPSTELKEKFCKKYGEVSQTTFRKYIKNLEGRDMVRVKETRKAGKGRRYIVSLVKRKIFK